MTADDIIVIAKVLGVELRAEGERLRFRPLNAPSEFVELLREHKPALLQLLTKPLARRGEPQGGAWRCRCGGNQWRDIPIHEGASTRRDCATCGRFVAFVRWYGAEPSRN